MSAKALYRIGINRSFVRYSIFHTSFCKSMNRPLSDDLSTQVIRLLDKTTVPKIYDVEKHRWQWSLPEAKHSIYLRLPIHMSLSDIEDIGPDEQDEEAPHRYIILLVQTESCALAYCEGIHIIEHKAFKTYAVRKKQGKSQIKYLNTRGKSKAGSRVRLANTLAFFENINERLQDYFHHYTVDRVAMSCSKILIPYLFNSKVACPFDKKDERIYRIPKHLHTPNFEILKQTQQYLINSELIYEKEDEALITELIDGLLYN